MLPIALTLAAQFAPDIVRYLTGGSDAAAKVAEKVVQVAQDVTGEKTPQAAADHLSALPEQAAKFRERLLNQELELARLALQEAQADNANTADARKRDTAIIQSGRYNWRGDILALLAVGGLVFCVYLVARDNGMEERAVNAIMFVAGVLAAAVRDVYNYEFGSSKGSKEKDARLERLGK